MLALEEVTKNATGNQFNVRINKERSSLFIRAMLFKAWYTK